MSSTPPFLRTDDPAFLLGPAADSSDLVHLVDLDGFVIAANQAWRRVLGFADQSLTGLKVFDVVHSSDAAHGAALFARLRSGDDLGLVHLTLRSAGGDPVELEGRLNMVYENGRPIRHRGVFRVRGERARLTHELQARAHDLELRLQEGAARAYFSDFSVEQAPIGMCWIDAAGRIIRCNRCLEELLEMQRHDFPLLGAFLPEGRLPWQRQSPAIDRPAESASQQIETDVTTRGGRKFPAALIVRSLRYEHQDFEFVLIRDITEQKQTLHRIAQVQRLESMGVFAGGIAHDLNNTLAPIILGLDLLRQTATPAQQRPIDRMQTSAQRAAGLVTQMMMFAKRTDLRLAPLSPQSLLEELGKIIHNTFPKKIQFEISAAPDLPSIVGDDVHLLRVLLNLTLNARDAMPDGGRLSVTAAAFEVDRAFSASASTALPAQPGRYVRFDITDTGTGIPLEIRDRIFDPFFTTKGPDKGTGLGLSAVLGILKGHQGFLQLDTEVGRGARFSLFLPAPGGTVRAAAPTPPVAHLAAGANRLALVVDDEAFVREVLKSALEEMGYEIVTLADGAQALAYVAKSRSTIGLLMTDLHMPNLNGLALLRSLRRIAPHVPLVAMSGHFGDDEKALLIEIGVVHHLAKPFNRTTLTECLNGVVAAAPAAEATPD